MGQTQFSLAEIDYNYNQVLAYIHAVEDEEDQGEEITSWVAFMINIHWIDVPKPQLMHEQVVRFCHVQANCQASKLLQKRLPYSISASYTNLGRSYLAQSSDQETPSIELYATRNCLVLLSLNQSIQA